MPRPRIVITTKKRGFCENVCAILDLSRPFLIERLGENSSRALHPPVTSRHVTTNHMALPLRLLGRLAGGGGGGGRRLPRPLAVLHHHHLSASDPSPTTRAPLLPSPPRLPPLLVPFAAVPARSFSWYPRSPPPAGPAAAEKAPEEDVRAEGEGAYLHDAGGADFGEVVATSAASADAAGVAAAGDGGSASGFAVSSLIDILDGFHNLTGIPWYASFAVVTALAAIGWNSRPHLKCGSSPV